MINHIGFVVPVHKPFLWFLTNASQILDEIHFKLVGFNLVSWWNTSDAMQTALFTSAELQEGMAGARHLLEGTLLVSGAFSAPQQQIVCHIYSTGW